MNVFVGSGILGARKSGKVIGPTPVSSGTLMQELKCLSIRMRMMAVFGSVLRIMISFSTLLLFVFLEKS